MRLLDVTRSRRLVGWAHRWHKFEAKKPEPDEPSIGRLVEELGEQLDAALRTIDALLPGGLERS